MASLAVWLISSKFSLGWTFKLWNNKQVLRVFILSYLVLITNHVLRGGGCSWVLVRGWDKCLYCNTLVPSQEGLLKLVISCQAPRSMKNDIQLLFKTSLDALVFNFKSLVLTKNAIFLRDLDSICFDLVAYQVSTFYSVRNWSKRLVWCVVLKAT